MLRVVWRVLMVDMRPIKNRTARFVIQTKDMRHGRVEGDFNNNSMERMNADNRDREGVMRGLNR